MVLIPVHHLRVPRHASGIGQLKRLQMGKPRLVQCVVGPVANTVKEGGREVQRQILEG